MTFSVTNEI